MHKNDLSQTSLSQTYFLPSTTCKFMSIKIYREFGIHRKNPHIFWIIFELVMNFLIWKKNKKCEKQCATVPQTSTACQKRKMKIKSQFWKIISTFIHVLRMFIIKIQHEQIIIKFNNPYTVGKISQRTTRIRP